MTDTKAWDPGNVDTGLGFCLSCLGEIMVGQRGAPFWAITLAPMNWPPVPDGIPVAVPACWYHVKRAGTQPQASALVVANGKLKGRRR